MAYQRIKGDADETIIRIDHEARIAEIWTMKRGIVNRLNKIGAKRADRQGPGYWYTLPSKQIGLKTAQIRRVLPPGHPFLRLSKKEA